MPICYADQPDSDQTVTHRELCTVLLLSLAIKIAEFYKRYTKKFPYKVSIKSKVLFGFSFQIPYVYRSYLYSSIIFW